MLKIVELDDIDIQKFWDYVMKDIPGYFFFILDKKQYPADSHFLIALEDEMIDEGSEYLVALRGDPVSQTALLSTTIQTAMLVRRVLDHQSYNLSNGIWGNKTFIFTDDF